MVNKFVLDTNLFFNLQSGLNWGSNSHEVIEKFTSNIEKLVKEEKASFYMTPAIQDEMKSFFDNEPDFVTNFLSLITIKSPDVSQITIGATVLKEFVDEARGRAYRGMKVAEEEIDAMAKCMMGSKTLDKIEYQKKVGEVVKKFRDRFRQATRVGFLDSVADFELIVLARELNGALVTADEGLIKWGRKMGIVEISPSQMSSSLEALQ